MAGTASTKALRQSEPVWSRSVWLVNVGFYFSSHPTLIFWSQTAHVQISSLSLTNCQLGQMLSLPCASVVSFIKWEWQQCLCHRVAVGMKPANTGVASRRV